MAKKRILTAAHCFDDTQKEDLQVTYGIDDFKTPKFARTRFQKAETRSQNAETP